MNRDITLAGFVLLAAALILRQVSALRARRMRRAPRPVTFGELVDAAVRLNQRRWLLLVAWLWLGWHLFARVHWR